MDTVISKSEALTVTKKLHRSGNGLVLPIPPEVVVLFSLDENSYLEATLKRVSQAPIVVRDVMDK